MFLHSCAGIKVKPETVEEVKKKFQGICLQGDGRGRVQFLTQGYSFAFENTPTVPENQQWDYILFSKGIEKKYHRVIRGKADHYLCIAHFSIQ